MAISLTAVVAGALTSAAYVVAFQQAALVSSGIAFLGLFAALVHSLSNRASSERTLRLEKVG